MRITKNMFDLFEPSLVVRIINSTDTSMSFVALSLIRSLHVRQEHIARRAYRPKESIRSFQLCVATIPPLYFICVINSTDALLSIVAHSSTSSLHDRQEHITRSVYRSRELIRYFQLCVATIPPLYSIFLLERDVQYLSQKFYKINRRQRKNE